MKYIARVLDQCFSCGTNGLGIEGGTHCFWSIRETKYFVIICKKCARTEQYKKQYKKRIDTKDFERINKKVIYNNARVKFKQSMYEMVKAGIESKQSCEEVISIVKTMYNEVIIKEILE
jgi:predicted nucleic-acid-binding Zn-ribbon protein